MAFQHPWWGLLAVPILAAVLLAHWRRPPTLKVSSSRSFARAGEGRRWRPAQLPIWLRGLGLLLLTVALMRPRAGIEQTVRRVEGIDIMLALDASGSMLAYDVPAGVRSEAEFLGGIQNGRFKNRIEIAKEELQRFVDSRPNDRIGLIAFATHPYVVCPPTLDHSFLLGHLERVEAGTLGSHTGIAGPLASATSRLKESTARRRVLVLFSDGDNNVEARVTPEQAARLAQTFDIVVHTVGVGSDQAYRLIDLPGRQILRRQTESFNRRLLEQIGEITGGHYFEARDAELFAQVMREIDALETTDLEQPLYLDYRERFFPWLVAGLAVLLLAFGLENSWLQMLP